MKSPGHLFTTDQLVEPTCQLSCPLTWAALGTNRNNTEP